MINNEDHHLSTVVWVPCLIHHSIRDEALIQLKLFHNSIEVSYAFNLKNKIRFLRLAQEFKDNSQAIKYFTQNLHDDV